MVRFRYKDYAHGNRKRVMTLTALKFVRRLLMHVLPTGFMLIRHYGILANRHRHEKLSLCRRLLGSATATEAELSEETKETRESPSSITPTRVCPVCGAGQMIVIQELPPMPAGQEAHEGTRARAVFDSSYSGKEEAVIFGSPEDRRERRGGESPCRVGKTWRKRPKTGYRERL